MDARTTHIGACVVIMSTVLWMLDAIELHRALPTMLDSCQGRCCGDQMPSILLPRMMLHALNLSAVLLWFVFDHVPPGWLGIR